MVFVQVAAGALSLEALVRLARSAIARVETRRSVDIMAVFNVGCWLSVLLRCSVLEGASKGEREEGQQCTYAQDGY